MRKEKYVTIDAEGRDKGKMFFIKEMPASQAERWAFRAFQALARTGADLPDTVAGSGMAGIAVVGLKALGTMPYLEAVELMEEMFSCIRIVRDKNHPETAFPLMEEDIDEISTRLFLRGEVFELHTGFSFAGEKPSSTSTPATISQAS